MNRSLSVIALVVVVGAFGVSLSSCNTPTCGPGTVQHQDKDGTLKCIPVDVQMGGINCDTDGGNVVIVGGKCVSAVQCDPGTTMDINGVCVGTGGGGVSCHTPAPGKACVSGDIHNFKDNAKNAVAPLHVDLFDPIVLLSGGAPIASTVLASDGSAYVFQDFTPPSLGLIVVMTGRTDASMTTAATGAQGISGGNIYRVDAYAIKKADSDQWGFDIATGGAFVAKFYKDPKPAPNLLIANETMPVAGVTLTKDGAPAAGAQYFDPTLTMVNPTLMSTSASGVAIVASPIAMGGSFPTFSGTGPAAMPIMWESLPGGSAPGLVLITRFHPNM